MSEKPSRIITVPDLRSFFFQNLDEINNRSLCPVPQETIFYSSDVMGKFAHSEVYFEITEGRMREKILGMKLLEATALGREEQRRIYQDVGDTALMVCGYFSESVTKKKILDTSYYMQLGAMAYSHLNNVVPRHMDVPSFFNVLASSFVPLTTLISMLASRDRFDNDRHLILSKDNVTDKELLAAGITPNSKKVS